MPDWARLVAVGVLVGHPCVALSAPSQRIQHIEDNLLPAAFVAGEKPETVTLASAMRQLGVPGVSVAFIHEGRIEWTDQVGVARLGGPPVDARTVFQAASISKPVTAMVVMTLVQTAGLDLDRDVNTYLRTWKVPDSPDTVVERVTLRRLLSHTAGISVHGFGGYAAGEPVPSLIQVLNGAKPANSAPVRVEDVPGARWSYSGGGYEIVQQLLTDLNRRPFAKLLEERVLAPTGMQRSSFEQPIAAALRANAATPYDSKGQPIAGGAHTYPEQAAAGLWTTPSDLARLIINFQRSLAGGGDGIVSPAVAHEMLRAEGKSSWGLGFGVGGTDSGHPYLIHEASNAGFRALLVAFAEGDGIVVMTNGDRGDVIAAALLRTVAVEYGWPEFQPREHRLVHLSAAALERLVGEYRFTPETTITVSRRDERLLLQFQGQQAGEIWAEGPASFFSKTRDLRIRFHVNAGGRATGMSLERGGATFEAPRMP